MKELEVDRLLKVDFIVVFFYGDILMVVEVSFNIFLFCIIIGDVYSWLLMVGRDVVWYKELNCEIIV